MCANNHPQFLNLYMVHLELLIVVYRIFLPCTWCLAYLF